MMRLRNLLLTTTALMPFAFASALAGPNGATVVGGSVNVLNPGTANVTVNQFSDKAIVNWNLFNIGVGEKTTFVQPNASSVILNRVTGGTGPSEILGSLTANGKVFLVNRDGIIFGAGATVTTAGFLATTSDIKDKDFMAGRYNFQTPGRSDASIVNMGRITATSGGFAALVAPGVRNTGTITATLGTVALGAGNLFTLDFYGDKLITLGVGDSIANDVKDVATGKTLKSLVTNEGKIKANGGRVELTAAAARQVVDSVINTSGVIEANSVGVHNGQIVLGAATSSTKPAGAPAQNVKIAGTLSAAGKKTGTKGGAIIVTGENIDVKGATIDASGVEGGGKVLIGGDWGGGKPDKSLVSNQSAKLENTAIPTATTVSVDAATKIDASATARGDGGKVVLWSDQTTSFAGTILALGGTQFGNGWFVETSSHGQLNVSGTINAGRGGTWLLDPPDLIVDSSLASTIQTSLNGGTNVTQQTAVTGAGNGDIIFNSGVRIAWNTSATLTLVAFRNITFNDGAFGTPTGNIVNTGAGNLVMRTDSIGTGVGTLIMTPFTNPTRINWTNSTGTISLYYNPTTFGTQNNFTVGNGNIAVASPSQLNQYMLVNTTAQLGSIGTNASTLGEKYAIGPATLNASGFTGFPTGTTFTGVLTGNGGLSTNSTISNLHTSLFPFIGAGGIVRDLNLSSVSISATANGQQLAALAGENDGTITNVTAAGTISGSTFNGINAGGLVSQNSGTITGSQSAVNITIGSGITGPSGFNYAGGLVGTNSNTISNSTASGAITGGTNAFVGGLVGQNGTGFGGTVTASAASGNVSGAGAVGGLVGFNLNGASITTGGATGNVTVNAASAMAGGLVGQNEGLIDTSSASGNVSGTGVSSSSPLAFIGGLVGSNNATGQINSSTATGTVTTGGFAHAGGLIGDNSASLSGLSASNPVNNTGFGVTMGGLIGQNNAGATITNSQAFGAVTSTANATGASQQVYAGGLVGVNFGVIHGTAVPAPNQTCAAGQSCATGLVSVGAGGFGGGFAGVNETGGTIDNSFATGAVKGAAGFAFPLGTTQIGGFVAQNSGAISASIARGNVTGAQFTRAGGFAGMNFATITTSSAVGSVAVGDQSWAGGFAGTNSSAGSITNSGATGNVSGGSASIAGGFVGNSDGTLTNVGAIGTVTASDNSFVGGLAGGVGGGSISNSQSTGAVSSTGLNSAVGGLVGGNAGTITSSTATGAVTVTAQSFAGGLVGINAGSVQNSSTTAAATVTGSGSGNIAGGFAGMNFGTINLSTAAGAVSSGANSSVGGLVGANLALTGVPGGLIAGSSYPNGTVTNSTATGAVSGGDGSSVGGLIGDNSGTLSGLTSASSVTGGAVSFVGGLVGSNGGLLSVPSLPSSLSTCGSSACMALANGSISTDGGAIANSSASGTVAAGFLSVAGGLAGSNAGTITNSQSTITLNVANALALGGLVGSNDAGGSIVNSSASGNVTGAAFALGGLVGSNDGSITGSSASGAVTGGPGSFVGGLAGVNTGTIDSSTASGTVSGGPGGFFGGLVAVNEGSITNSSSTGAVVIDPGIGGGLVGYNLGTIANSHSTGAVSGDDGSFAGGLVGFNILGAIQNSYSVSNVTVGAGGAAGGLTAANFGAITQSFATGAVTGGAGSYVGGLVAYNFGDTSVPGVPIGTIAQSYATGAVTGGASSVVGGLVAENAGSIDQAYAAGRVTGGAGSITGGLVASNNFAIPSGIPGSPTVPGGLSTAPGTATNSYWDTQTTGQSTSAGGTPQTTAQLTTGVPSGFSQQTWSGGAGANYPILIGQPNPLPVPGPAVPGVPVIPTPIPQPAPIPQPTPTPDPCAISGQCPTPPSPPNNVNTTPLNSPQLVVAANLVKDALLSPTTPGEVVTPPAPTPPTGAAGGAPGGGNANGGRPGGNPNAGRPAVNQVPPPGLGPLPSGLPPLNETRFPNNEVVVQLGAIMPETVAALARELGLEIITQQDLGLLGRTIYRFRITSGLPLRSVIPIIETRGGAYVSAQPSYQFELTQDTAQADLAAGAPADTNRKGDSAQYIVDKLNLPAAHLIATGKDVKVAVIDSEIDAKHPDLEGVIAGNYDALPSTDQTPHPHGTGMAGAIGSHQRLLGVAPGARILAIRAFGASSDGAQGTSMNIVKGLDWAVQQGARIINMSFAGPRDPILQQAIKALNDKGIILIAAAGNAGPKSPPLFPGAEPNVIAVSATDVDDKTYKNANRGKYVAIAAPGVDILVPAPEGGYQLTTGTSVAAAEISGVAALLLERNAQLKPAEIRSILTSTAKNIGGAKTDVGAGLVDPVQALSKAGPKSAELR